MKNRIREFRVIRGLSQEKLAAALHTTKQTVSRLEKGRMPLTQLWMEKIAPLLGRQPHELISPESAQAGHGQRVVGLSYYQLANSMSNTDRAAEILTSLLKEPIEIQKTIADWLIKLTGDQASPPPASSGETAKPKKKSNPR